MADVAPAGSKILPGFGFIPPVAGPETFGDPANGGSALNAGRMTNAPMDFSQSPPIQGSFISTQPMSMDQIMSMSPSAAPPANNVLWSQQTPSGAMAAMDQGNIGNIGSGDAPTSLPSFAQPNYAGTSGANIGDMSFTNPDYNFNNVDSHTQALANTANSSATSPGPDQSFDTAKDPGANNPNANAQTVPQAIDQQTNAAAQDTAKLTQAITTAATSQATASTKNTQSQEQTNAGFIANIENWFATIFARGGFVLLGLVFVGVALYMLTHRQQLAAVFKNSREVAA